MAEVSYSARSSIRELLASMSVTSTRFDGQRRRPPRVIQHRLYRVWQAVGSRAGGDTVGEI